MRVHDSQAYRKMDMTRKCISRILELREILLSIHIVFSLVNAAVACAILQSNSGLKPLSVITEPRYLKLVTIHFDLCVDATRESNASYFFRTGGVSWFSIFAVTADMESRLYDWNSENDAVYSSTCRHIGRGCTLLTQVRFPGASRDFSLRATVSADSLTMP